MIDINAIAAQVKYNCNISDARFWGNYSPCGLLLRMRDLYKIESNMKPWDRVENKQIGQWIQKKEKMWQELESSDFRHIEIAGKQYRPFDVRPINSVLAEHGYIYGGGYGNMLKPVFILAELSEKGTISRYTIYIAGREIARDLSTSVAMIQGNTIFARQETMHQFLWGKFEEMKARTCHGALFHAFSEYGISRDMERKVSPENLWKLIEQITREELSTYIHHELGEASQRRVLGRWWKHLLLELPHSKAELFLRSLKDVLSDTCRSGMLSYIIQNKKAGSLGFYVALLGGMRRLIFPGMHEAYENFTRTRNWGFISKAQIEGHKAARSYVTRLKDLYDSGKATAETIEQEIMPSLP